MAVAAIGTGRTPWAVLEVAGLSADDVVVVTAAAGGLGTLFVRAALAAGAEVVGLAGGAAKVDLVRSLGATAAVDYRLPRWPDDVRDALGDRQPTLLLDGVGGAVARAAFDLLAPAGRVVLFGWSSGEALEFTSADLFARGLAATVAVGPRMLQRPGGLRGLETRALAEAAAGRVVPHVGRSFPLAEAAAAHRALEARDTVGKVVLVP